MGHIIGAMKHTTIVIKLRMKFDRFCLASEAEARHMYCFSSVVVVSVDGVNFFFRVFAFRPFSQKL